ncbi:hypothetical protein PR202_gb24159 [Eleusine coracana subsp. coracana]|uniref:Uncharacterized protein n=1 Tax=Eleusine coracana subsp. coracana TaxID=191504 RepID=A0AAV5FKH8_ELECO|nr:hypothetical protein PR202_gb24159 [Eleusine coracana subsp. coracana]
MPPQIDFFSVHLLPYSRETGHQPTTSVLSEERVILLDAKFGEGFVFAGTACIRKLFSHSGHAGIGCYATLAGATPAEAERMAGANREFDQLTTMATTLLNAVT